MTSRKTQRFLALTLAVILSVGLGVGPVHATGEKDGITWEELDPSDVNVRLFGNDATALKENEPPYKDTDVVRALIILNDTAPVSYSEMSQARQDTLVTAYAETMSIGQAITAANISRQALDGKKLDVVWSFEKIANAISVNVEYGRLQEIASVRGVKHVFLERRYEMLDEPNNLTSQQMTGADGVKSGATGYYGAGTSVAIIDTGLSVDHISFDAGAFEYALKEDAGNTDYDTYVEGLDLLTVEKINAVLDQLNVKDRNPDITAEELYRNMKVPFAFNYATGEGDVSHPEGDGNEHGSHVAGIAAANRYLPAERVYDIDGDRDFDVDDAQAIMDMAVKGQKVTNPAYTDLDNDGEVTAYDAYLMLSQNDAKYVSAADSVRVDGVAPDAQIVAMAVFGEGGGTYSSDYIAALEDAVTLGVDVSNLSLGSPQPGYSESHMEYDPSALPDESGNIELIDDWINGVFDKAVEAGMVVSISAGNSGNWADEDEAYGLLYADEGGVGNLGAPGSFTNAFTVASADNTGSTVMQQTVATGADGARITVSAEDMGGTPAPWSSLDPDGLGTEYDFVFLGDPTELLNGRTQADGTVYAGDPEDFAGVDFKNKIAVVARGNQVSFIDKHQNAEAAGAVAVIVFNNEPGPVSGTVAGGDNGDGTVTEPTTAKIPVVGISMEDGLKLLNAAAKSDAGVISGKLKVINRVSVTQPEEDASPKMSYFSSWGTTGDLKLKPEITAPGGAIMSVNGAKVDGVENTTGYELMSGTSMSSPHNAGLAALGVDYVTANGSKVLQAARTSSGNDNLTAGALVQSLLMSTAVPLIENEEDGIEYSVRNQGAGLANIANAVHAKSFITVAGADTGKVKAELGAKADGKFTFTFTVNNLTAEAVTYTLSSSILGQGTKKEDGYTLATDEMVKLTGATVTYDGAADGKITVPANSKVEVTVTIQAQSRAAEGFTNGYYVEGFIYLKTDDGVRAHSIPLLGWYGDWTAPSMFDGNKSLNELYYEPQDARPTHMSSANKNVLAYAPYDVDRNSINTVDPKWEFYAVFPTLIRSAKDFDLYITGIDEDGNPDFDKIYYEDSEYVAFDRSLFASFYYTSAGQWYDVTNDYGIGIEWDLTDGKGERLKDGEKFMITFVAVPEYGTPDPDYEQEEDSGERSTDLKEYATNPGTSLHWTFTVDNKAPEVVDQGEDTFTLFGDGTLEFYVKDDRYVAAVVVLDGSGSTQYEYLYPDISKEGSDERVRVDLSKYREQYGDKVTIAVCDYAGNETYYGVNLRGEGKSYGEFTGFQFDGFGNSSWVSFDKNVNKNETFVFACEGVEMTAAEYVNGMVFAQAEDGKLYGFPYEDMLSNSANLERSYITTLPHVYDDLAYNYKDGRLYGMYSMSDSYGNETHIDAIYLEETEGDWDTIEAYSTEESVAQYSGLVGYTLAINDDGNMYVLGLTEDEDEKLGTTAHLWKFTEVDHDWYTSWNGKDLGDTKLTLDYLQSATWNHNNEKMYWARFIPDDLINVTAELYEFDIKDDDTFTRTKVGDINSETAGLFAPLTADAAQKDSHTNVPEFPTGLVGTPVVPATEINMTPGSTQQLDWYFDPWYAAIKTVSFTVENDDPYDDEDVVTVDANGLITAHKAGGATIMIASANDRTKYCTVHVMVSAISAEIKGFVENHTENLQNGVSQMFTMTIKDGKPTIEYGNRFTAEGEFAGYGTMIATSQSDGKKIWVSEYKNTGMIYGVDSEGKATDLFSPIDGDMMFGLGYSEGIDKFMGIMNFYLYADIPLPLSDQDIEDMENSWTEEEKDENGDTVTEGEFTWHRINMAPWLNESQGNLVTQEESNIAKIVFCGITSMPGQMVSGMIGGVFGGINANYLPDTTWVLLDNVGRLWYIDELTGVKKDEEGSYILKGDSTLPSMGMGGNSDIIELPYDDGTYSLFVVRELVETPLYDMILNGEFTMTYNFSDIQYAGQIGLNDDASGSEGSTSSPIFFISVYDYFNEAKSSEMYLYVQNRVSQGYDSSIGDIKYSRGSLYHLGDTGLNYINASIYEARYLGGIEEKNTAVTYDPGDLTGTNGMKRTVGYCSEESGLILPTYPEEFSMFLGWNVPENMALDYWTLENSEERVDPWGGIELEPGLVFVAHWKTLHSLTLKPGNLEGAESVTVYPNGDYYSLPRSMYQFTELGWYYDPDQLTFDHWEDKNGDSVDYLDMPLTEDTELTAVWRELVYGTITFHPGADAPEGCEDAELSYEIGEFSTYELPDEYSFEWTLGWEVPSYYTFQGWVDAEGKPITDDFELTEEGAELTATWTKREPHTDTSIKSITYTYYDDDYDSHLFTAVPGEGNAWTMTLDPGTDLPTATQFVVLLNDEYAECNRMRDIKAESETAFTITVHAEDGSTAAYTLTVIVKE